MMRRRGECVRSVAAIGPRAAGWLAAGAMLGSLPFGPSEAFARDAMTPTSTLRERILADRPPPVTTPADGAVAPASLFESLAETPADASFWMRCVDVRGLLHDPAAGSFVSALATALGSAIEPTPGAHAKGPLAAISERLDLSPLAVIDRYLGRDTRLVLRGSGETLDWCLLTRVAQPDVELLLTRLGVVARANATFDAPDLHLAFAHRGEWLVIARDRTSELFQATAAHPAQPIDGSLREALAVGGLDDTALATLGGGLASGRLAAVFRGNEPFVGTSVMLADVREGRLRCGLVGRYRNAPFPGQEPRPIDLSVIDAFRQGSIAVQVDPIRTDIQPSDAFIVQLFPELRPTPAGRANFGDRRLILIGEVDGRSAEPPLRMRVPAIAIAYEVEDPDQAADDQDRMMSALIARARERFPVDGSSAQAGRNEDRPATRPVRLRTEEEPRRAERRSEALRPWVERYLDNHPLLRTASINWQTIRQGDRGWQVYATHAEWLASVSAILAAMPADRPHEGAEPGASSVALVSSAGCCSGERLASHVRTWTDDAAAFGDIDREGFALGIELIASIAERFRGVRWTMTLPEPTQLELHLDAQLAPPSSGGGQRSDPKVP